VGGVAVGELKRAAVRLGVSAGVLREQGWRQASESRVQAVLADRPGWLVEAQRRRGVKMAKRQWQRSRRAVAARLGVQMRVVREREIQADAVPGLLADPPLWLVEERHRQQLHIGKQTKARLRAELSEALVAGVHLEWMFELKCATSPEDVEAIDARFPSEVVKAMAEAGRLVAELPADEVRARIERAKDLAR
jgi:hypothetical protein